MIGDSQEDDIFYEDLDTSVVAIPGEVRRPRIIKLVKVYPRRNPKLLVYECKRGIRFIYKARAGKKYPAKWKLCRERPKSVDDVFRVLCGSCKDRVKETHLGTKVDQLETTKDCEELADSNKPRSDGVSTLYKADFMQYKRDKRSQYPGDYISDNVWWYNQGYFSACRETSNRVPSWCLGN
jgi:hypothetical protein